MVSSLNKVWTSDPAVFLSDYTDYVVQYLEGAFYFKEALVAAGHAVILSTDGSSAPSASDQWASAAALVYGDAADPRAWAVLRTPPNSADVGVFAYTLIGLNNPSADTTPTNITLRMSSVAFTGGSTTAYPTSPNELTHPTVALIGWSTPRNSIAKVWRTADGDVIYGLKPVGLKFFTTMLVYRASAGFNDSGYGGLRVVWGFLSGGVDANAVTWAVLGGAQTWRGFQSDGSIPASTTLKLVCPLDDITLIEGRNEDGSVPTAICYFYDDSTALPRYYGIWLDVMGAPNSTPFAEIQSDDVDAIRLINVGVLYLPTVAAQIASDPRIP